MAKCLNCDKDAAGRSKYCGNSCKVVWNRKQHKPESVNRKQPTVTQPKQTDVIPNIGKPANFGQPDCECKHCQSNRASGNRHILNHGPIKMADELGRNELNRASLPGDVGYKGICNDARFNGRRKGSQACEVAP